LKHADRLTSMMTCGETASKHHALRLVRRHPELARSHHDHDGVLARSGRRVLSAPFIHDQSIATGIDARERHGVLG